MNPEDTYEYEDRVYINPTQSRDEQLAFVDAFRQTQDQSNQQIQQDTYNLGTQVPSSLGGLTSGANNENSYWRSRYQTPQVNAQVATLQSAAQASALNNILANEQAQIQNKYTQAYRDYTKRQAAKARAASSSSGSGGGSTTSTPTVGEEGVTKGETTETPTSSQVDVSKGEIGLNTSDYENPVSKVGTFDSKGNVTGYKIQDLVTGEVIYYDLQGNRIK